MTRTGRILALLLTLVVTAGAAQGQPGDASVRLDEVRVEAKGDTVQITTSGAAKYQTSLVQYPSRLVIDFQNTTYAWRRAPRRVGSELIREIRGSQYRPTVARLVIEFARPANYTIVEGARGLTVALRAAAAAPAPATSAGATPSAAMPKPSSALAAARPQPLAPRAGTMPVVTGDSDKEPLPKPAADPKPRRPAPTLEVAQAETSPAPATPPAPPAMPGPGNGSRLISLDFKDADVVNLLRILAAESGRNIVIGDDVKGKMSITLRNVPWQVALDTILEVRGLQKIESENLIRIVSAEQLAREREAKAKLEEAKRKAEAEVRQKEAEAKLAEERAAADERARQEALARGPLREETIRLSYADPADVAATLQGILGLPPGATAVSPLTPPGPPPIVEPPFSALYGTAPPPVPRPAPTPSAEVLSRGITIQAHKPTNSIFIRYYERDLERIKKLIRETLDIPLPQVKIEARLESLDRNALENIGVTWGGAASQAAGPVQLVGQGLTSATAISSSGAITGPTAGLPFSGLISGNPGLTLSQLLPIAAATGLPTGGSLINLPISALPASSAILNAPTAGLSFGIIGTKFNVNLALQALAEQQKTRTIARPEVVTVENAKAIIQLGREIPYATVSSAGTQVQFRDAVLQLQVTPLVIDEGNVKKIKMLVLVENNEQGADTAAGPTIQKRRAETQVLVKEGEHLVIGGVGTSTDQKTIRKVPVFGDIPVLGWLFKQKGDRETSSELVVFITPTILKEQGPAQPVPPR